MLKRSSIPFTGRPPTPVDLVEGTNLKPLHLDACWLYARRQWAGAPTSFHRLHLGLFEAQPAWNHCFGRWAATLGPGEPEPQLDDLRQRLTPALMKRRGSTNSDRWIRRQHHRGVFGPVAGGEPCRCSSWPSEGLWQPSKRHKSAIARARFSAHLPLRPRQTRRPEADCLAGALALMGQ